MITAILQPHVSTMKFGNLLRVFIVFLLPMAFFAVTAQGTATSAIWNNSLYVGLFWLAAITWYRKPIATFLTYHIFLAKVKMGYQFKMKDAKKLVSRFATDIYRIDSKKRQIQFFINDQRFTLYIQQDK